MYTYKNESSDLRVGFTVSKKIGNAVIRNKVKRKIREICRLNLHNFKEGYDIIFVAKSSITKKDYNDISKEMNKLFKISKVIKSE